MSAKAEAEGVGSWERRMDMGDDIGDRVGKFADS